MDWSPVRMVRDDGWCDLGDFTDELSDVYHLLMDELGRAGYRGAFSFVDFLNFLERYLPT